MARIAFLGTGLLGGAFAQAAAQRGDTVTAWNRSADKVAALAPFGVKAAATAADAVRGAVRVHIVLKDDAVVDAVIAAALPGLEPGAVLLDHTTTLPVLTAARSARLAAQGVAYLHCPVFMGPAAARNAQGSMMVAGPKALFDRVQAALAAMTTAWGLRLAGHLFFTRIWRQPEEGRYKQLREEWGANADKKLLGFFR